MINNSIIDLDSRKRVSALGPLDGSNLYQRRNQRASELKASGKKIIGYFCCYPPIEIMTAAGVVPYRIVGNPSEPITKSDSCIETEICPFIRNCFDAALKEDYKFLDGIVIPHSCDFMPSLYSLWKDTFSLPYIHFIQVPHTLGDASHEFFRLELLDFKRSLEEFTQIRISERKLVQAIELHNNNRALLRKLYKLRKSEPPSIYGSELLSVVYTGLGLPVEIFNALLRKTLTEVIQRRQRPQGTHARLLISGSEMPDITLLKLIESCGANIVMDDLCIGTRFFWHDVETSGSALDNLTRRYLNKSMCPRTYREGLEERFAHIKKFVDYFKVNGVILWVLRFCIAEEMDIPDLRDYLHNMGLPVLCLEEDYAITALERVRTRIQAFVETLLGSY